MSGSGPKKTIAVIVDWILDHTRIVMPSVLLLCVLITVVIALNANKRSQLNQEAETMTASVMGTEEIAVMEGATIPDIPLEEGVYPEVDELIQRYYQALAEGDVNAADAIDEDLDDLAKIHIEEMAKYIDHYDTVNVYTKAGLDEESFVTYVYSRVKFKDVEELIPGLQTFYVTRNDSGTLIIRKNDLDSDEYDYIKAVSLQDDVVDMNNRITVEYNDLIASNQELEEFIAYMTDKINEDVGVILAQNEQPETAPEDAAAGAADAASGEAADEDAATASSENVILTAKATDVVNIRSSDSETADRLAKAEIGQEFTVLEQRGNGWSRVTYEGGEAFIKSDFLEVISEEVIPADEPEAETEDEDAAAEPESAADVSVDGTVRVLESVRVRSTPGTDGEALGTVYGGEELDLVEQMDNGWTKVTYDGQVGYVKSDYVE